jgi:hypothetical protein
MVNVSLNHTFIITFGGIKFISMRFMPVSFVWLLSCKNGNMSWMIYCHEDDAFFEMHCHWWWDVDRTLKSQRVNIRVKTFDITRQKQVQNAAVSKESDFDAVWDSQEPILWCCQKTGTTAVSAYYNWDALGLVKTSCLNETLSGDKRCCSVPWQCLSTYCHPHCWYHLAVELKGAGASSL